MKTSISTLVLTIVICTSDITVGNSANADYITAIEQYDIGAWASYDSVDRHEVTTGTDRGAQSYVYWKGRDVQRIVFDYGLSQSDALYFLLYKDGKLVKIGHSRRGYRSGKDGELAFCQPYPQVETTRIYFRESEVVCLSSEDKNCEAIRSNSAKREAILTGASDLLRHLSSAKPDSEVPDVDFLKYF